MMHDALPDHQARVTQIQDQIRDFYKNRQRAKIYHGSSNSTRPPGTNGLKFVDVSRLTHILEVNADEGYVLAEPNVPLDALVDACLERGAVPPMIAEFPGITVGGAVQGGSGESSSFKWGTFHEICLEYEVVLGNGHKVTASPSENPDLFHGSSCAFGSLGVITLLKIKLVPATPYVKLSYFRTDSSENTVELIRRKCAENVDFVDGILFSPDGGVVMSGTYSDASVDLPIARFSRPHDDWFYIHAEHVSRRHETYEELIPLKDYLFRYDRGGFWVAKYGFRHVPFNRLTRALFASLFHTRTLFKLLHGSNYAYVYLAQDICLPERNAVPFLEFAREEFGVYPLWLCPLKAAGSDVFSPTRLKTDLVINVGIWGEMKPSGSSFTERNRQLEKKVAALDGRKVLYAHAYYTEKEFWKIYDHSAYENLRAAYDADVVFPDLYQKIITRPPTAKPAKLKGLKGLLRNPYRP